MQIHGQRIGKLFLLLKIIIHSSGSSSLEIRFVRIPMKKMHTLCRYQLNFRSQIPEEENNMKKRG